MLDLPAGIPACLFDRDGVLTRTAKVHARAWKRMFGSVRRAEAACDQGLRRAVVSSSTNCHAVLVAAGIEPLFEERFDGLAGKPAPERKGADVVVDGLSELLGT